MKPKWIIQNEVFSDGNPEKMVEIIKSKGMEVSRPNYVPFNGGVYNDFKDDACVVSYGSINLVKRLLETKKWYPNAWMNLENLACRSYYSKWHKHLYNKGAIFLTWGMLKSNLIAPFELFDVESIFIKPDANLKTFGGTEVDRDNIDRWFKMTDDCYTPEENSLVLISTGYKPYQEYRFVVCKGKVITGSLYKTKFELKSELINDDHEAFKYAETVVKDPWQPDDIYVLDICCSEYTNSPYSILEIGSVNCAGLYACDLDKVVDCMTDLAIEQYKEYIGG